MNQALYAHMNNKRKMKKTNKQTKKPNCDSQSAISMYQRAEHILRKKITEAF
jgi:hypothetical protein